MNYLLFICSDGQATPEQVTAMGEHMPGWVEEMDGRGIRRLGTELAPPSGAVSVRVRDGETLVSDGPFAETKEFVAGFDLVDCGDLDAAIEVAAKHPVAWFHCVEVRPFADGPMGPGTESRESASDLPTNGSIEEPQPGLQRYLLLMCLDGIPASDEEEDAIRRQAQDWLTQVRQAGAQVYGHALAHADTATTVRVREGETLLADGPFVEVKEFIGGFDILDCSSRQEAIQWAAKHPLARYHVVEVRPFAGQE